MENDWIRRKRTEKRLGNGIDLINPINGRRKRSLEGKRVRTGMERPIHVLTIVITRELISTSIAVSHLD